MKNSFMYVFLLSVMVLSPFSEGQQNQQEKSEGERQLNTMKIAIEAFIIIRAKAPNHTKIENVQFVEIGNVTEYEVRFRCHPLILFLCRPEVGNATGIEEVIENIDNPNIIRLFEITNEADEILKESCGEFFDVYCWPFLNNLWFSDIETEVLEWASNSYDERQSEGEPEGMEEANVSELLQRLIDITREKDQIITDWERSNY